MRLRILTARPSAAFVRKEYLKQPLGNIHRHTTQQSSASRTNHKMQAGLIVNLVVRGLQFWFAVVELGLGGSGKLAMRITAAPTANSPSALIPGK